MKLSPDMTPTLGKPPTKVLSSRDFADALRKRLRKVAAQFESRAAFAAAIGAEMAHLTRWIPSRRKRGDEERKTPTSLPNAEYLYRIAFASRCSAHWLITGEGPMHRGVTRTPEALATDLTVEIAARVGVDITTPFGLSGSITRTDLVERLATLVKQDLEEQETVLQDVMQLQLARASLPTDATYDGARKSLDAAVARLVPARGGRVLEWEMRPLRMHRRQKDAS